MAYNPTIEDMEEIEQKGAPNSAYQPSLSDMEEIEKSQNLHIGNTGLTKNFQWSQAPQQLAQQVPSITKTALGNTEYGALNLGRRIGNTELQVLESMGIHPSKIAAALGLKGVPEQIPESYLGKQNYVPANTGNTLLAQGAQMLGGAAPLMLAAPEAEGGALLTAAARQAPKVPGFLAKYLGKPLGQYGKNVAVGTAMAPFYSDQSAPEAAKTALTDPLMMSLAAAGPLLQSGSDIGQGLGQKFKRLGGTATPEEVQQRMAALEALGIKGTPPAKIITSPSLARTESFLSVSPGSPMAQAQLGVGKAFGKNLNETLGSLGTEGEGLEGKTNLREEIAGEVGQNYSAPIQQQLTENLQNLAGKPGNPLESRGENLQEVQDELNKTWADRTKINQDNYDAMSQTGRDEGAKVAQNNITDKAKEIRDQMDIIKRRHTLGGFDSKLYKDLNGIIDQKRRRDYFTGKTDTYPEQDFKDVNALKKYYWGKSEEAFNAGNKQAGKRYRSLYHAYDQDIKQAAVNHVKNNPESKLLDQYMDAQDYYKKNIVPIETHKELFEHVLRKRPSEQLAQDFVKSGPYENSTLAKKLTDLLSPESRNKVALSVATRNMDEMDPKQLFKNVNSLGANTKRALFQDSPEILESISNTERNFDPKLFEYGTGEREAKDITKKYVPLTKESENPALTNRLMNSLSPTGRAKVLLDRISKGQTEAGPETQLTPQEVIKRFDKLPPRTKEIFNQQFPGFVERMKNLKTATGMYPPGEMNAMLIPKTGFTSAAQEPVKELEKGLKESLFNKKNLYQGLGYTLIPLGLRHLLTKALLNTNVPQRYLQSFENPQQRNMNQLPIAQLLAMQQAQQANQEGK